ncbi:MAG: polysaccharide biosynthesis/export family protein [Acidobacteriaceae bacterium]|nr:polysaccharide biosynthesis/export family protein [Acidobacteriaceae bacterium]MBV9939146.1 polysaccharide biosynthesis/export family protein [Acidobacteriaceae bacterium]
MRISAVLFWALVGVAGNTRHVLAQAQLVFPPAGESASDASGANAATRSRPQAEPGYVLGPGDQISIHVVSCEEINDKPIPIDLSGMVHLPLVGDLKVSGSTIQQLQAEITDQLKQYLLHPDVSVSVVEFRSQPVSVVGAVKTPGVQQVQGRKTLLEMLSLAGGLDPSAGSVLKITRQQQWGPVPLPNAVEDATKQFSIAEINLKSLIQAKHPEENISIKPHDIIAIPRAETIYVIGEVQKSGSYMLSDVDQITVLQALSMAGGLNQMARARETRILRRMPGSIERTEIPVDLSKLLNGRSPDIRMQPDDILFVPNNVPKRAAIRAIEAAVQIGTGVAIWR